MTNWHDSSVNAAWNASDQRLPTALHESMEEGKCLCPNLNERMIDPHVEIILPLRFGHKMSLVVRKPAFCICENKDADLLRGNRDADQRLCFHYTESTIFLLPKYKISSIQPSSAVVQPGLCHTWSETPETGFLRTRLKCFIWKFSLFHGFMKSSCQPLETDKKVHKVLAHYLIEACL